MKISTKGRYALHMLIDLAEHGQNGYVSLKDISHRQGISKKYLEQIVPLLNNNGVLKTTRGFQGGYMLAKEPDRLTVGQVLRITEGGLSPVDLAEHDPVNVGSGELAMLPVWQELDRVINGYLDSVTLGDVIENLRSRYSDNYII